MSVALEAIGAKVAAGRPLEEADAGALAAATDIVALGMIADEVRRRRHGTRATFLRVAHAFWADAAGGAVSWPEAAREVRLDGTYPGIDEAVAAVRYVAAAGVPVTGSLFPEVVAEAGGDHARLVDLLSRLREAGLCAIAAAPLDGLPDPASTAAASAAAGLPIGVWTVEAPAADPLGHIRALQRLAGSGHAASVFAPVPRRPSPEPTTGYADVKAVALARILLDVPHIQVDWALHGPKLAQVALTFGADDVDDVSPLEETAEGRRRAPLEEIRRNIRAAGFEPVERDGRFGPGA